MVEKVIHQGRNVKLFRKILGKTQEDLAFDLDITQQAVSLLEDKEIIDPKLLEDVAKSLKVPVEAIKNFTEDAAYNIIGNTVTNNQNVAFIQNNPTINPIDAVVQVFEKLLKEKDAVIEELKKAKK